MEGAAGEQLHMDLWTKLGIVLAKSIVRVTASNSDVKVHKMLWN